MYLGQTDQEQSTIGKAGAGILNSILMIGAAVGIYLMSKNTKKKKYKSGYSRRKYTKGKTIPLP